LQEAIYLMKKTALANIIFLLTLAACSRNPAFDQTSDGIVINLPAQPGKPSKIKLQVISDKIIRVVAAPADSFSTTKSFMVNTPSSKSRWDVEEAGNEITLSTSEVKAKVDKTTGEIVFSDKKGNVILTEEKGGGKKFTEATIDNFKTYQIRQIFESPADEAFYGLGGHQNGQMNYKGEDVELAQHNIVDVIPFLYSNKNYGILWDNYSISRFGDEREYQPLNTLKLFSKDGKPGGLTADYYVGDKISKSFIEDKIGYEFLETPEVDNFPKDVAQNGKVIWEGAFSSEVEGIHKFLVYSSGYFKVWINGKLIMDKWRQNWNPWTNKFTVPVRKGDRHSIRIEWKPEGGFMAVKHLDPLPGDEQNKLTISSEVADQIDYYFIKGDNADDVIKGYRTLTGKAPIVPKWALGFWQSRERYRNQKEVLDVVQEYRSRKIPLDNIVLDWQYWEDPKWGSHEFDVSRFPDPRGMVEELHNNLHANIMISVWPKFNKGTAHYEEMRQKGYLFTRNIDKKRKDWVGVGYESTFYDPFNPGAGVLFWQQIDKKLNSLGFDAWWLDATEPDMHSNLSIEERKNNMSPTALGPGSKYFNAYSLLNSKSVYEGSRRSNPDKRVFILTRSAFGGQQRFGAATWSGDIVSRWSDFKDQIATGINFSLSGIPYWTMDIGGFAVESRYYNAQGETLNEWREMNTRWFQFGAFCPIFRSHGQYPLREIYNIAPEGSEPYNTMVYYDRLRYRLMPYIYSVAGWNFVNDYTMMRGLVMDFPEDKKVIEIADQYMFGPSILVNPVTEYKARSREVYLPSGNGWYDFYSGKYFEGGQTIMAEAQLDKLPLFVKAGSILPVGPELQYTSEKYADPITLYVYTGRDATFDLYEDDGLTYGYEKDEYTIIPLRYDHASQSLTIGNRKGSFENMLDRREFSIIWVNTETPEGVSLSRAQPPTVVKYSGNPIVVKMKE
jgi:alpha-D-xyloside xylohydrolase